MIAAATPASVPRPFNMQVFQEKTMRNLVCLLVLSGASVAVVGCTEKPAAPPAADTNTDLGPAGNLDKGNPDTTGSTTN